MIYLDSLRKFSVSTIAQNFKVKITYSDTGTAQIEVNNQVFEIKKDGKGRYCFVVADRNYKYLFEDLDGKLKPYTQANASFLCKSLNRQVRKLVKELKTQMREIAQT